MKFKDAAHRWNERFSANEALFGEQPNAWLAAHADKIAPDARVVCIADGQGRNGLYLAKLGHHVIAFDLSTVAVDQLKRKAAAAQCEIDVRVLDIAGWQPEPDSADAVVAVYFQFAEPSLRARIFEQIARCLRPGGLLLVEGYGPRQLQHRTGGPGVLENLYAPDTISNAFSQWSVLASRDCDTSINEGDGHDGISHVVSAVLRKPENPVTPETSSRT